MKTIKKIEGDFKRGKNGEGKIEKIQEKSREKNFQCSRGGIYCNNISNNTCNNNSKNNNSKLATQLASKHCRELFKKSKAATGIHEY